MTIEPDTKDWTGPRFANWDQDATAVEDGYAAQDPVHHLNDVRS